MKSPTILVSTSILVACAAIAIGYVSPQLFLRIPRVGFILWAMAGNPMPPFFDTTPYTKDYFHQWAKDGDLIVASPPKAGTVWMLNIVHLLKHDGNDDFIGGTMFSHIGKVEWLSYPEHSLTLRLQETNELRKQEHEVPLLDKGLTQFTHFNPPDVTDEKKPRYLYGLDVRRHPKMKYIVVMRHLKETTRSTYSFFKSISEDYRQMWGGFPPSFNNPEEAVDFVLQNQELFFYPAITWWKYRKEPNVLLVNFKDLKTNIRHEIERVASFLEIDVTHHCPTCTITTNSSADKDSDNDGASKETLLDAVARKASFKYMKERESTNPGIYSARFGRPGEIPKPFTGSHINKGVSGKTEEFFTEEMNEKFEKGFEEKLRQYPDLQKWIVEGGPY